LYATKQIKKESKKQSKKARKKVREKTRVSAKSRVLLKQATSVIKIVRPKRVLTLI